MALPLASFSTPVQMLIGVPSIVLLVLRKISGSQSLLGSHSGFRKEFTKPRMQPSSFVLAASIHVGSIMEEATYP
jgi:hypothetical protein